ncbi:hypothetical protein N7I40_004013 [Vibrio parahaemolyticus]|uniref:hypothetical protein n=1 Tax=Vibrio harveyi group TaxID=717610 RepID=UPI00063D9A7B|nr:MULTISPECIES: hypothetical protein [Vibrio harveyi group]EGR3221642.1 hypothetical protein [Vibrio parahaemolyticus]EHK6545756.1 hypothetical protein [Vibrio parahaemolyticus]EJL8716065.1 hypothetical protein [Vibrio alginolyticus]EJV5946387.1 hypothetical protein [Vibrio parahaemolyticus]EKN4564888.1 hypothetical protein [Vibrio parahaemolyticus]
MSARLFFAMEKQIPRIRAETDLRGLAVISSVMSGDKIQEVRKALVVEQGEVFQIERKQLVYAEKGAIDKLKALMA